MFEKNLILIGSTNRNSGKTTLAVDLIQKFSKTHHVYGLKVISRGSLHEPCHRGSAGCGACLEMKDKYVFTKDKNENPTKDTALLLQAGAKEVYLLRTLKSNIKEAYNEFKKNIPENSLIICESNSLSEAIEPGLFIMMKAHNKTIKPSAEKAIPYAHIIYENDLVTPISNLSDLINVDKRNKPFLVPNEEELLFNDENNIEYKVYCTNNEIEAFKKGFLYTKSFNFEKSKVKNKIDYKSIKINLADFDKKIANHKDKSRTKGFQYASIYTGGNSYFSFDVGRHNSVDKVIGKLLLLEEEKFPVYLFISSRISADIVKKAISIGAIAIVSFSVATSLALEIARENDIQIFQYEITE